MAVTTTVTNVTGRVRVTYPDPEDNTKTKKSTINLGNISETYYATNKADVEEDMLSIATELTAVLASTYTTDGVELVATETVQGS